MLNAIESVGLSVRILLCIIKREWFKAKLISLIRNNVNYPITLYSNRNQFYITHMSYLDDVVEVITLKNYRQMKYRNKETLTVDAFLRLFFIKDNVSISGYLYGDETGLTIMQLNSKLKDIKEKIYSLEREKYRYEW